jgi:hypothetical protein
MIQVCMGQHYRVNGSRIKGKFFILNPPYGISSLVHAAVEQDTPYTRAFQQVTGASDLLGGPMKRNRCHTSVPRN